MLHLDLNNLELVESNIRSLQRFIAQDKRDLSIIKNVSLLILQYGREVNKTKRKVIAKTIRTITEEPRENPASLPVLIKFNFGSWADQQ